MNKKLLIDAENPEEIRVASVCNGVLEEFEVQIAKKRPIRGNVYLAKVLRIEPALQAAFVDYGRDRQGFLPFSEIHPDYFYIPTQNVEKNLKADPFVTTHDELITEEKPIEDLDTTTPLDFIAETYQPIEDLAFSATESNESNQLLQQENPPLVEESLVAKVIEKEIPIRHRYRIQDVIRRHQIILVQVVKEERAHKGATVTTYLSLPGRYCVLMPNAGHRVGGISRKISDESDRKRLAQMVKEFEVPEGMAVILRTAGYQRTKGEIRRDFDYLMNLWEEIRNTTLQSRAPSLVYEEGDIIKKAIRDIYSRDMIEILVEGEEAYKESKELMKKLIPSHSRKIQRYKTEKLSLFQEYKIETQINEILKPTVYLPSGGHIVISPTEALTAIDVNSGKATREKNIEDTALKTNLEAAYEAARQIRLRDIAGLIVIDFIDMPNLKNVALLEKKMKDLIKLDRSKIQIGKITSFGLLEISRQRMNSTILELHAKTCNHCNGTGVLRSIESSSIHILRSLETALHENTNWKEIYLFVPSGVDSYLLNQKRSSLNKLEARYNVITYIFVDSALLLPEFKINVIQEKDKEVVEVIQEAIPAKTKFLKLPFQRISQRKKYLFRHHNMQKKYDQAASSSQEKSEKNYLAVDEDKQNKKDFSQQNNLPHFF